MEFQTQHHQCQMSQHLFSSCIYYSGNKPQLMNSVYGNVDSQYGLWEQQENKAPAAQWLLEVSIL